VIDPGKLGKLTTSTNFEIRLSPISWRDMEKLHPGTDRTVPVVSIRDAPVVDDEDGAGDGLSEDGWSDGDNGDDDWSDGDDGDDDWSENSWSDGEDGWSEDSWSDGDNGWSEDSWSDGDDGWSDGEDGLSEDGEDGLSDGKDGLLGALDESVGLDKS
jgi:hypothetical protein